MASEMQPRTAVLQGTLDMLILRTLLYGPAHGHPIGKHIRRTTNDFLQMRHGSFYPVLHRLEKRGWVASKWEAAPDRNQAFKYYRLRRNKAGSNCLSKNRGGSRWLKLLRA
jgi:PadR family transcriptional regulator, regulatory protein PadR